MLLLVSASRHILEKLLPTFLLKPPRYLSHIPAGKSFIWGWLGFAPGRLLFGIHPGAPIGVACDHPCLHSLESAGLQAGGASQPPVTANKPGSMKGVSGLCTMHHALEALSGND